MRVRSAVQAPCQRRAPVSGGTYALSPAISAGEGNRSTDGAGRRGGTELAPHAGVRILHVGNAHLVDPLRALGHEVIVAFEEFPALAVPGVPFDVRALWRRLPFAPDLLLVADTLGRRPCRSGSRTYRCRACTTRSTST